MKKLSLAVLFGVFAVNAFAASTLNVKLVPSEVKNEIAIRFSTVQTHSSMCHMSNVKLEMQAPPVSFGFDASVREGAINVQATVLPKTMCLTAFGPNSGSLTLTRGYSLPQLANGNYRLTINGESYGTLVVRADSVQLVD